MLKTNLDDFMAVAAGAVRTVQAGIRWHHYSVDPRDETRRRRAFMYTGDADAADALFCAGFVHNLHGRRHADSLQYHGRAQRRTALRVCKRLVPVSHRRAVRVDYASTRHLRRGRVRVTPGGRRGQDTAAIDSEAPPQTQC